MTYDPIKASGNASSYLKIFLKQNKVFVILIACTLCQLKTKGLNFVIVPKQMVIWDVAKMSFNFMNSKEMSCNF